ncbi:D-alanyl-D-alanine carboxypeptidase family protein [Butyrivibrio sp. YAB3001]|uniref:D-alanyl-D-alanine carboxypeptidase family protein n=1 Tax=Butyrivibrio sp. YAB3001 TaxID=1520812 RepID=UPI0008F64385|nr:D-alanyl-D-alanine carboxypeptidase [Butyrivibrio sp. YAB3001]SFB67238.1 D-alanyl-D-alanine carboxypeptidase (penicillin-binding protein 5/6) [Butyrivibrio sp. YAB3001]
MEKKVNFRQRDSRHLTISEYKAKRKREIITRLSIAAFLFLLFIISISCIVIKHSTKSKKEKEPEIEVSSDQEEQTEIVETTIEDEQPQQEEEVVTNPFLELSEDSNFFFKGYSTDLADNTSYIASENVISTNAILVNLDSGSVVANKDGTVRINPASMTKILTLLVAAEHITDLDDTFVMTQAIGDFVFKHDCSAVGFSVGETITVRDMLYGTILPSGGDAAMCIAEYIAGSQEAFVEMMNDKLKELGLSDTAHFTNCIGIYDENHYCTLLDMAMILKAAEENALCHDILNARKYTTSSTTEHPEGISVSNWFMRRIEDKDTHGEVIGAKTGFVVQSGCCGASYQISNDGTHYICVTANAWSSWRCIYDHVEIYDTYTS